LPSSSISCARSGVKHNLAGFPGIFGPGFSRLAARCLSFIFRSTKLPLLRSECVAGTYYRLPRRLRISLAATTPEAEACMRPLVIPAPSPMAKRFLT